MGDAKIIDLRMGGLEEGVTESLASAVASDLGAQLLPLLLIGVNHRTAPVEVRERLSVTDAMSAGVIASLASLPGVVGATFISTCNRVEAVVSAGHDSVVAAVIGWLAARGGTSHESLESHVYVLRRSDVVKHLFRVASGLDSMIVGEPQIAGQVKAAFNSSQELGLLDPLLNRVYEQTMRVAKRVRTDTGIGEFAVSVPYAAVELARKIFGKLRGLRVLLLGAGEMGELTAEHLAAHDVQQIFVANKTFARAQELAQRFRGEAVHFDQFDRHLETCDIVIASTAAPHFLIGREQIESALAARRMRGLFLIDLAVPRNIDPSIAQLENVYLYNIDDLQQVADANRQLRQGRAAEAEALVESEVDGFRKRLAAQDAVPTILELQTRLEEIRVVELDKCLRRLGPVTAEQRAAIEQLTTQLVNKILHYPIVQLKDGTEEPHERETLRETIRKIFGLR